MNYVAFLDDLRVFCKGNSNKIIRAGEVITLRQRREESPSSAGQGGPETGQGATPWTVPQKRRPPRTG